MLTQFACFQGTKQEEIPVGSLAPSSLNVVSSTLPEGDANSEACVLPVTQYAPADAASCANADLSGDNVRRTAASVFRCLSPDATVALVCRPRRVRPARRHMIS